LVRNIDLAARIVTPERGKSIVKMPAGSDMARHYAEFEAKYLTLDG
jgi:hypothetical protein